MAEPQLLAPLKLQQDLLELNDLVPDEDRGRAYISFCTQLLTRLQQQGVAVLELDSDEGFSAFARALDTCADFFASQQSVKLGAQSAVPGEGYAVRPGKELLAVRPGAPAWGSGRSRTQHAALQKACCASDRLARGLLAALCRSPALDLHSGRLLGLLDDTPLLGQAGAGVLRVARYSPHPEDAHQLAFAPHHDRGVLTLVASAAQQGLQVQVKQQQQEGPGAEAAWVDVPLGPGRLAVLCGYSLSYGLGGMLQPVLHRVQPRPQQPQPEAAAGAVAGARGVGGGGGRVSLAYELCFRPNACVDPAGIMEGAAAEVPADALASRPALLTSALMERFAASHPVSINVGQVIKQEQQPWVKQEPGANAPQPGPRPQPEEPVDLVSEDEGEERAAKRRRQAGGAEAAVVGAAGAAAGEAAGGAGQIGYRAAAAALGWTPVGRSAGVAAATATAASRPGVNGPAGAPQGAGAGGGGGGGAANEPQSQQRRASLRLLMQQQQQQQQHGAAAAAAAAPTVSGSDSVQVNQEPQAAQPPAASAGNDVGGVPATERDRLTPAAGGGGGPGQDGQHVQPGTERSLDLTIKGIGGPEVRFTVKPSTPLQKICSAYCRKVQVCEAAARFMFDGQRFDPSLQRSAEELGMQDGDVIDFFLELAGS
ncbi:hypothetical protein HYH02_015199 [Chlamydomonas schloesseri]|uniref:Ubiquitin-like domain-containing protein n=1 Tax=Chlamydomonas schloesseri TaxID=2026947 RepID=A0A835SL35_9CHLO|nr:hypothetical protein HYH02_015199 [Chlamydomonas schloesseri]|eukprot:KAG2424309.1 hypothetical protein HYH02_015199 [Chlamydomonas schloesseri]